MTDEGQALAEFGKFIRDTERKCCIDALEGVIADHVGEPVEGRLAGLVEAVEILKTT